MKKKFKAANGITFLVRIVPVGAHYGAQFCLTNSTATMVEFYDTRRASDYDFVGSKEDAQKAGAEALGQFVTRYFLDTLRYRWDTKDPRKPGTGLDLMGYEPSWKIDGVTMDRIHEWLDEVRPESAEVPK